MWLNVHLFCELLLHFPNGVKLGVWYVFGYRCRESPIGTLVQGGEGRTSVDRRLAFVHALTIAFIPSHFYLSLRSLSEHRSRNRKNDI